MLYFAISVNTDLILVALNKGYNTELNIECNNYGYINESGEQIIDFKYNKADSLNDGLAAVGKITSVDSTGNFLYKMGYVNPAGDEVIELQFYIAYAFSDGIVVVGKIIEFNRDGDECKYGYINKNGELIVGFS